MTEALRSSRRQFLEWAGLATAALAASTGRAHAGALSVRTATASTGNVAEAQQRRNDAYRLRLRAAQWESDAVALVHPANGDEHRYERRIGNYSKGLPHDYLGLVDPAAYASLLDALSTGAAPDFERIILAGTLKLTNPQAGLAFDVQGPDSHALTVPAPPSLHSAEQAGELVENYWMALLRDVPFSQYEFDPLARRAAADLSRLTDFRGPRRDGRVDAATLFRGTAAGCLTGPYLSQFFWKDTPFGAESVDRRMRTTINGVDYLTGYNDWLAAQNGFITTELLRDPVTRYARNGRDLGEWVHSDLPLQAYVNALLILMNLGVPFDEGNPYNDSRTQDGFTTLGYPHVAAALCAVTTRALKAAWFQKWYVHRRLRPEEGAGLAHNLLTGNLSAPLHSDVVSSDAVEEVLRRYGSYLLPMAYAEGCPAHPSYTAGHATVAGACVTVLKAFFDESFAIPDPVEVTADGLMRIRYRGADLTVGGELDKLAANVAIGRNIAGVHWRTDASASLALGEEVAVRFLTEERACLNEAFTGLSFTRFDGTRAVL